MIIRIEGKTIFCDNYGLPPGAHEVSKLPLHSLLIERKLLLVKRMLLSPHSPELAETDALADKLALIIDNKCKEKENE